MRAPWSRMNFAGEYPAKLRPVHVHLGKEVPRLGGAEDPFESRAAVEDPEFAAVVVEAEADAERPQRPLRPRQLLADPLAGRRRDKVPGRPPGAGDVAGAEKERVADDRIGVVPQARVAHVHAGDLQARGVEGGLRALCVEVAVAGELDAGVADPGDLGGRRGEVPLDVSRTDQSWSATGVFMRGDFGRALILMRTSLPVAAEM
jgi:hypothetical protein